MFRQIKRARRGKMLPRILTLLVLTVVGIALVPVIVAKTSLRDRLLAAALPTKAIKISTGGASFSWFAPPVLRDVGIFDAAGNPLASWSKVALDRTPMELIRNSHDLGQITVESPTVYVKFHNGRTNWEEVLARLESEKSGSISHDGPNAATDVSPPPNVQVRVTNARVLVEDAGQLWRIESANIDYQTLPQMPDLIQLTASAQVIPGQAQNVTGGPFDAAGRLNPGAFAVNLTPLADGRQQIDFQASALPIESFGPFLARMMERPHLHGSLTISGVAAWMPAHEALVPVGFTSNGHLSIDGLELSAKALANDQLYIAKVDAPWRISSAGDTLLVEEFALRTDVGQLTAQGTVHPAALMASAGELRDQNLEVIGNLDLAKLAAMMPEALRIREGTAITSGQLELAVRNEPIQNGQKLTGTVRTSNIAATNRGQRLGWDQPVRVDFDAMVADNHFRIESLKCIADFCQINAQGDDQNMTAHGEFDLNKLSTQLGQFVDLREWKPGGSGTFDLVWQKSNDLRFNTTGDFVLRDFSLESLGRTIWAEPLLTISATAGGLLDRQGLTPVEVHSSELELIAEGDQLDVKLLDRVNLQSPNSAWPLAISAGGDAARWLARCRPFVDTGDWQISGQTELAANATLLTSGADISNLNFKVRNLHAENADWLIDEPRLELTGDMRWDSASRKLVSRNSQFICTSASMAAQDLHVELPDGASPQAQGAVAVRADLARLGATQKSPEFRPSGMVSGNLTFEGKSNQVAADLNLQGQNLTLAQRQPAGNYFTIWEEQQAGATGHASYAKSADRITLDSFRINSNTLAMTASGTIDRMASSRDVDLRGAIDYDLTQLTPLLKPYLGEEIRFVGREQATFELAGSLAARSIAGRTAGRLASSQSTSANYSHWSRALRGRFQAPWQSADMFGLPIGPGRVGLELADGNVRFDPLRFAVGRGQMNLTPHVQLDPQPQELTLPREQILSQVDISREVSNAMLKYIAPVLADATRTEGLFSLNIDVGRLPLADPKKGDISGQLAIHTVDVLPGPSTEQMVGLVQQVEDLIKNRNPQALASRPQKRLMEIRDKTIPFRMVEGRVYHEGLEFNVGEVLVRSQGSVGLDESLDLMLLVPIQDKWVGDTPFLRGLRGQAVQIPVRGDLSRPRPDPRAITSLSQQLLQSAAQEALGGELNKALDKLFGR